VFGELLMIVGGQFGVHELFFFNILWVTDIYCCTLLC
jgi:hypothetical protein